MVKNELSIRSQQSYDVSMKIAEHEIKKIKDAINKEITEYKCLVTFRPLHLERKLYEASKVALKENVEALFEKSSLLAQATYFKNEYAIARLGLTFIKTEKDSIYRTTIKHTISRDRSVLTAYESNYLSTKFKAQWAEKFLEEEIDFKLKYDNLVEESYNENSIRLNEKSYNEFYNNLLDEFKEIKTNTKNDIDSFYPVVEKAIDETFTHSLCEDLKVEVIDLVNNVINDYQEMQKLSIDVVYKKVDLGILNEQTKEGLNVADEITLTKDEVSKLVAKKEELSKEIESLKETIVSKIAQINDIKASDASLQISVDDESKQNIINVIAASFKGTSKENFKRVYDCLKDYILNKCPFFNDYLSTKEQEYLENGKQYRSLNSEKLPKELQSAYLNNHDKYLTLITNLTLEDDAKNSLLAQYKENVSKIKQEFKDSYKTIRDNKKARRNLYKQQKDLAKVNLKMADATKASEIREVVKLYKKEINSGEHKRYLKVLKAHFKKCADEKKRYSSAVYKASNPAALSLENEYKQSVKEEKKTYRFENKKLRRNLRKEKSSAKFRKDVTSRGRENKLGYIFLSIWAIGFVVLTLFPIFYTIIMVFSRSVWTPTEGYSKLISFSLTKGITLPNWSGKDNFETLFLNSYTFTYTQVPTFFKNLLFYVPIVVFISFVLAMLLNSKIRGRTLFRIIYFLPVVIVSGPVLDMLNSSNSSGQSSIMLRLDGSSLAKLLSSISPKALQFANQVFGNFIIILWMTGVPIVLFISALQKINKQLYEAAEIDGANKWQSLWTITFPLIKSVVLIVCLFTIMQVSSINVSSVNPINSVIDAQMKNPGKAQYGVIALEAWIQTIIVLFFVLVSFLLFREREFISKDKNYEEIEEAKRKKNQRKAKVVEFFHITEIKNFTAKLFAPISKLIRSRQAKKKQKEEMGG